MSEIFKGDMPCVEDSNNQFDSNGLPAERFETKRIDEQMGRIM